MFVSVVFATVSLCTNAREYLVGRHNQLVMPGALNPEKDFSAQDEIPNDATSVVFDASYNMGVASFGFSHLSQCESLKFHGFAEIIEEHAWYGLSNIKDLIILDSSLRVLNENCFQHLASLERLYVIDSKISTVDATGIWSGLTSLLELRLGLANINSLERNTFHGLSKLQNLSLTSNKISEIKYNAFNGLRSVRHISLNHNSLTKIDNNMWRGLDSLTHLSLAYNEIATIEVGAWMYVRNTMFLDLSHNALNILHPGIFSSLQVLKELKVNSNNISEVSESAFSGLRRIQVIWLASNRLATLSYTSFNNDDFKNTGGHPGKIGTFFTFSTLFISQNVPVIWYTTTVSLKSISV